MKEHLNTIKDKLIYGKIINSISINSIENYSIYIPKSYSLKQKYNTIIFFDPHAEGPKVLEKYKDLAEKWNFIIAASNNCKNGVDMKTLNYYASNLITHIIQNYSVNNKITLAGFSGGAKVALGCGIQSKSISNIIYCGAAIPINSKNDISFLGFAGLKDMNYSDLVYFDSNLKPTTNHYLIEWNGIHEWPSKAVFDNAFYFIKNKKIENYDSKKITTSKKNLEIETSIKNELIKSFNNQNLEWWKSTIKHFNTKKSTDLMYQRLLGFISLACYSQLNNLINQGAIEDSKKILEIYILADPTNSSIPEFQRKIGLN